MQTKNIDFQLLHYDSGGENRQYGEHAAEALGQDPSRVFKTLIVIIDGNIRKPLVALIAVSMQLDLKRVAAVCRGRKAAMADPTIAQRVTGYVVGGISPLGQKQKLTTLIDESAFGFETIFISAGKRGLELEISPNALIEILDAHICNIAK